MEVDEIYLGPASINLNFQAKTGVTVGSSPTPYGIGPLGRQYFYDMGTPATLSATAICAAQAIAGAANATINGTLATAGVATIPEACGRCLSMISTNAGDTTQTVTLTGKDYLGNAMTERRTLNGTTIVNFTKSWKSITQVAVSAALAGNLTVGNRDVFGIPVYMSDAVYFSAKWANTIAGDAGTFAAGDATLPATNATNDTRGTYAPSSASNGSRRLIMHVTLSDIHVGPKAINYTTATATGCYGVTPV